MYFSELIAICITTISRYILFHISPFYAVMLLVFFWFSLFESVK